LRLVLRNLLANAVAAGAREVHVRASGSSGLWVLTVDDDGVGLGRESYASGSGLGLSLTRRFLSRQGAILRLEARAPQGTRARLEWRDDR
jgi:signal transduction histidine kinase